MYGMTPMGVFFTAIFPPEINEQALCQQPHFVRRFFAPQNPSGGLRLGGGLWYTELTIIGKGRAPE